MGSSLVIVEVSQKQAYIFSSSKLRDNITNSAAIAYVTSSKYFETAAPSLFTSESNKVYCGGGHAILEFASHDLAKAFITAITRDIKVRFPKMELFATIYDCGDEPSAEDVFRLIQRLEQKKSIRRASFKHGSFGIEAVDAATGNIPILSINNKNYEEYIPDGNDDWESYPSGYARALAFSELGGSAGDSNFIAVVHIDGNAMGKRVEQIRQKYGKQPWASYKKILNEFSESVDAHFKSAFVEMCATIERNISDGTLGDIELDMTKRGVPFFPVRRIITEGDDVCFVTEGRIGIECARIFLEHLGSKVNRVDKQHYAACAGVAIVHQKYPFYMANELAEMLCSNAKKYIANATKNVDGADASNISAIDWHLDMGELADDLDAVRAKYATADGCRMELRPYVVKAPEVFMEKEKFRNYENFYKISEFLAKKNIVYARGKIKELRSYIREGEISAINYLKSNLIYDLALEAYVGIFKEADLSLIGTGQGQDRSLFVTTSDGEKRAILFDAIEMMDTYISLKSETKEGSSWN